jgi:hypothetical protein
MEQHHSKERECEGANFAQMIRKKVKKAFPKQSHKHKKHWENDSKSDSDSDYSLWSHGSNSTGELIMYKKPKLNSSVNSNSYPSLNKAIQQNKIESNNKIYSEMMQEDK